MADSLSELNKAVAKRDPQAILEAIAGLVGVRMEYATQVEQATDYQRQVATAQELAQWVQKEHERGFINAEEHAAIKRALGEVVA